ncbi:hypothetical protein BO71DRAFT_486368 [Aspergillus ellipticus CBS 707.79]|uniref:SMODS and SLOG-associating 2TM effector domain-containing protein n=1 Tax=Aspergillus ellipticus CBS 707.79 TaxID=1448320 RepID=A0A319D2L9_9EURO|nr:hypothetical protein BO71DRAFT_486368 [Aspergillus ellipticus CBS 707.79]
MAGRQGLARRLLAAAFDREEQGLPPVPQAYTHHANPPQDVPYPGPGPGPEPAPAAPMSLSAAPFPAAQPPPAQQLQQQQTQSTPPRPAPAPNLPIPTPTQIPIQTTQPSLVPPTDKLLVFRALTGIEPPPLLTHLQHIRRIAPNIGIYTRVIRAEQTAATRYRFFSVLINVCLGIQIVVAAALTALGAASGPHSAVTAFGAINTIMAGVLTYLKGSGLPDRLKHYQNEWRNIREYVEQRERELCLGGCELDVFQEVQFIEYMYEGVKREIEATKIIIDVQLRSPPDIPTD